MNFDEAMQRFKDAVNTAVYESAAVREACANLKSAGAIDGYLEIRANFTRAKASPLNRDAEFLRQLRITPDLEVRE